MTAIRYPVSARIGAFSAADWTITAGGLLTLVALPDLDLPEGASPVLEIRAGSFRLGWEPLVGAVTAGATFQINQILPVPPAEGAAVRVWIRLRVGRKYGRESDQKSVTFNFSTGSPTPTVTGVFASAITTTTATANWQVNQASGTSYVYVSANASESVGTVKSSGASQTVTTVGAQTRSLTSLTAATAYYLHVGFNDGSADSAVASAAFTTQASSPPPTGDADVTVSTAQALTTAINAYAASNMGAARVIAVTAGSYGTLTIADKTFSHRLTIRSAGGFGSPAIFSSVQISDSTPLTLDQVRVTGPSSVTGCADLIVNGCEIFLPFSATSTTTALDVSNCSGLDIRDCAFRHGGANSLRVQYCSGFVRRNVFEETTDDAVKMNNCTGLTLQWNVMGIEVVERSIGETPHWDSVQFQHVNNDCVIEKNICFPMTSKTAQGLFNNRQSNQAIGRVNTGNIYRHNWIMTSFRNGIYFQDKIGGSGASCEVEFNTLCYNHGGNSTNGTVPAIIQAGGYSGVTYQRNFGIRTAASQNNGTLGTGGEEYQVPGGNAFTGAMNLAARCKGPTWNTGDPLSHWEPLHGTGETQSYQHATPVGCYALWEELDTTGYPFKLAAEAAWNRTANSDSYFSAAS